MSDSPLSPEDIAALFCRISALERLISELESRVFNYLAKERETAIITFSHIEDELGMARTKEKRNR